MGGIRSTSRPSSRPSRSIRGTHSGPHGSPSRVRARAPAGLRRSIRAQPGSRPGHVTGANRTIPHRFRKFALHSGARFLSARRQGDARSSATCWGLAETVSVPRRRPSASRHAGVARPLPGGGQSLKTRASSATSSRSAMLFAVVRDWPGGPGPYRKRFSEGFVEVFARPLAGRRVTDAIQRERGIRKSAMLARSPRFAEGL